MTDLVAQLVGALEGMLALDEENHQRYPGDEDVCKEVRDARAALSAAKDGGWLPIETMPAEGKFLVFMPTQRVNQIQAARRHNGLLVIGNAFAFDISDKPTAWQPLPNPPKGEV